MSTNNFFFQTPQNSLVLRQSSHFTQSHLIHSIQDLIHLFLSQAICNSSTCFVGCSSRIYPESIYLSPFPITPVRSPSFFIWPSPNSLLTASHLHSCLTMSIFFTAPWVCFKNIDEIELYPTAYHYIRIHSYFPKA